MQRVLGLDIGTNSVGWAVIDVPEAGDESGEVIALGSRVFPEGAEQSGSALVTKGADRRSKRGMRRQIARRAARRRLIRHELEAIGLLPDTSDEFEAVLGWSPQALSDKAARGERLELFEIGRVLYWVASRRGFLSLRSGGSRLIDDDDDAAQAKRFRLNQYSAETGERLVQGVEDEVVDFLRGQSEFHPELITDGLIFGVRGRMTYPAQPIAKENYKSGQGSVVDEFGLHGLLFFQRSVYWRRATIGKCSLDPHPRHARAARAERQAQVFRIWKTIVDLRVGDDERSLDQSEREKLFDALSSKKTMTFGAIKKLLGLDPEAFVNLESENRKSVDGNATDRELASKIGDAWDGFDEDTKDRLVFLLLGEASEEQVRATLISEYGLSREAADAALGAKFQSGRMNYSRPTITALLEHLPGATDERAAIADAGFVTPEEARSAKEVDLFKIPNPRVKAALSQVGRVVKAVAKEYGHVDGDPFDVIRIELTRDVKANQTQRQEMLKQQRDNQSSRSSAVKLIEEWAPGAENSRETQRRARLWMEQGQHCLYTGQPISPQAALSSVTEIDHILPRSATLDNSLANSALVMASANQDKGDRTIFEWGGPAKAQEVVDRAKGMGLRRGKIAKLGREHVDAESIPESLVVTTGYINAVARDYVENLTGVTPEVTRGRLTAHMRYRLGLSKDQTDHRRHALDAAMVALTSRSVAMSLAAQYKREESAPHNRENWGSWEPWMGARTQLDVALDEVIVSHKVQGRIRGQLHEETRYGKVASEESESTYARRRPLAGGLSKAQLNEVADPVVRSALVANLIQRGIDPDASKVTFDSANPPTMPDGQIIKSVRCHANYPSNFVLKPDTEPRTSVTPAGNARAFIFFNEDTQKHRIVIIDRFEAFRRRNQSIGHIAEQFTEPGEHLRFSLCIGEAIAYTDPTSGTRRVDVVKSLDRANSRVYFRRSEDSQAGATGRESRTRKFFNDHDVEKVVITPAGLLRWARD